MCVLRRAGGVQVAARPEESDGRALAPLQHLAALLALLRAPAPAPAPDDVPFATALAALVAPRVFPG